MAKDRLVNDDFRKDLKFEPLGRKNWDKFVELFGEKGGAQIAGVCITGSRRLSSTGARLAL